MTMAVALGTSTPTRCGGGDEDLRFVFAETFHDGVFSSLEGGVEKAEFQLRKNFLGEALVFLRSRL